MTGGMASGAPDTSVERRATADDDYRALLHRLLLAYGKRIRAGGPEVLADLIAVRAIADAVIDQGVADCREEPHAASWAEIGAATGMTRSAAHERWGELGGVRRPGGQPSGLR
jgi:hypothetical protein